MNLFKILFVILLGIGSLMAQAAPDINCLIIFIRYSDDFYPTYPETNDILEPTDTTVAGWPTGTPINDTSSNALPDYWDDIVDTSMVSGGGSYSTYTLSDWFYEMSNGTFHAVGKVHPRLFVPYYGKAYYQSAGIRIAAVEALDSLDAEYDYADYNFVGFCFRAHAGVSGLTYTNGWTGYYSSTDSVSVKGTFQSGFGFKTSLINILSHEFCHNLGLFGGTSLDDYNSYSLDYVGIGGFGVMGHGSFDMYHHIAGMSGMAKQYTNWVSVNTITSNIKNLTIDYIGNSTYGAGAVIEIPVDASESFYIENRQRWTLYDEYLPYDGLLIYHYDGNARRISPLDHPINKYHSMVDLECADGRWQDKGWSNDPSGQPSQPDPKEGQDNLEWCRYDYYNYPINSVADNQAYNALYNGNKGDTTDFFDGINYTSFTDATNPSSQTYNSDVKTSSDFDIQGTPTHIAVLNIRRDDNYLSNGRMYADIYLNNWTGHISSSEVWSDSIHVSGDIIIDAGATLTINAGTKVIIEPNFDDQDTGSSTSQIEFIVNGKLDINGASGNEVTITSCDETPASQDWYGIRNYGIVEIDYCDIKYARTPVRNYSGNCLTEINNCLIDSFYNYGVYATTGSLSVKNSTISNPTYNSARGMSLGTSNLTFLEVENNTIMGFTGTSNLYGIFLSTSTLNANITGNILHNFSNGANRYGIYIYYCDNITVSSNTVYGVADFVKGIYLSGSDDCIVENNIISYCTAYGLECYNSSSVDVNNNLLKDNGSSAEAILFNGSSTSGDIRNNHICSENESYSCNTGIHSISNAIGDVLSNTIEDFTDLGIRTGTSGDSLFCGSSAEHGNNSVYWNFDDKGSSTGYLFILSESGSTTPAQYNYFGSSPSAGNFYYLVDWSNYLGFPESDLMVMYYKNNTGSGSVSYDECLLGNDGSISGASWTWEGGDLSYVLDYDGANDYVDISHSDVSDIFNNDDDFTIVAWVNPDSFPVYSTTIDGAAIVGQQYCTSMVFGVRSDGKLFLSMDDTNLGSPKSNSALTKNQWQQVAVTYDNSVDSCRFYINGEYNGKGLIADNTIGVQDVLFIGWQSRTDPSYRPGYFNGGIDEVRIYNHVLTEVEIDGLYDEIEAVVTKSTAPQVSSSVPTAINFDGKLVDVIPNPMSSSAGFTFKVDGELSKAVNVKLCIFNYAGKLVYSLMNSSVVAGRNYQVIWDGKLENGQKAPEGIYYYEYTTPDKSETGKLMLVK